MNVEGIIDHIEQLQEMFEAADMSPLSASDISAARRRLDGIHAESRWFRLWQPDGIGCRPELPCSDSVKSMARIPDNPGSDSLRSRRE